MKNHNFPAIDVSANATPFTWRLAGLTLALGGALLLSACGGGGGASVTSVPNTGGGGTSGSYTGPAPTSNDIQAFRLNLWENINDSNRCGQCHSETGGQPPLFARNDDVNLAYSAAMPLVNKSDPKTSRLVTKVGGGHNCWLTSDSACAATMTAYIQNWVGGSSSNSNVIDLVAPVQRDVGASKNFPDTAPATYDPIHTKLTTYCASCHSEAALLPQTPYFANSDKAASYDVVKSKISLDTPSESRLVQRLRDEFHNCWDNCAANAQAMLTDVQAFADSIAPTVVDPALVVSKALRLGDGIVANSGGRHETNVVALFEFKTGSGSTAFDTSGIEPSINMTLTGDVEWLGNYGLSFKNGGKAQGLTAASDKLRNRISASGEYSIEAWVVPANVVQEDANIISYSGSEVLRNFTMGQTQYNYDFLHRSSTTQNDGNVALSTAAADEDLQATLQHVVMTFSPGNGRRIYVNGVFTGDVDAVDGGNLSNWDDNYALVFGNETSNTRDWTGSLRLVAIHDRELTQAQITANFDAGVGQKFYLLFNVTQHVNLPDSYVVMPISQFDNYSYLFENPFFISLDSSVSPSNVPLEGMRIGINGREAAVGQAYQNLNVMLDASTYNSGTGQVLSPTGTIIAIEKTTDTDEFFLTFERLGNATNVVVEADPIALPPPPDVTPNASVGVRTFEEISASMSTITGVSSANGNVRNTYNILREQMPVSEGVDSFVTSNQAAIAQLAIRYCNELVGSTSLRSAFFNNGSAFNFAAAPSTAAPAGTAWETQVVMPLVDAVTQSTSSKPLAVGPNRNDMRDELLNVINVMGVTHSASTNNVVVATCASALGSAAMLIQ